jgi:hypothetical protein
MRITAQPQPPQRSRSTRFHQPLFPYRRHSGATNNDGIICAGAGATLTATGGGTYSWSTGGTTAAISVTPSVTTTYTVTVTNANSLHSHGHDNNYRQPASISLCFCIGDIRCHKQRRNHLCGCRRDHNSQSAAVLIPGAQAARLPRSA